MTWRCMATKLVLIRHGETDWNIQGRYLGHTDIGLNANGLAQAERLAGEIDRSGLNYVYASDMSRAFEFARIVFPGFDIFKIPFLREMDFGLFEGRTHAELIASHPELYRKWVDDPFTASIPGAETFGSFEKRIRDGMLNIISRHMGKKVAVVTHSGPIRVMLRDHRKVADFWGIETKNASVHNIEVE